jgi:Type IV secretory system Conjugative DNA transfer
MPFQSPQSRWPESNPARIRKPAGGTTSGADSLVLGARPTSISTESFTHKVTSPARKTKPTWFMVATADQNRTCRRPGVPPSDISRTKPLVRLILNQIGRRLTEDLHAKGRRHRLLLMPDEFPALGRLDFFESAPTFKMTYVPNNAILDNWQAIEEVFERRAMNEMSSPLRRHILPSSEPSCCSSAQPSPSAGALCSLPPTSSRNSPHFVSEFPVHPV